MRQLKAVAVTGDIKGSTKFKPAQRRKLQTIINNFIRSFTALYPDLKMQQYRGDSMQLILTKNRAHALYTALQLQLLLMSQSFYLRLGIGIGTISFKSRDVITSDGSAFHLSGPMADELKKRNELIGIAATDENFSAEWKVHNASLNFLLQRISAAQAEALNLYLQGMKQQDIAKTLKISQPSVHQRLQAAGAPVFSAVLERFEHTITLL